MSRKPYAIELNRHMLLVLLMLADGPLHGYQIIIDLEALEGGQFSVAVGTLYRSLWTMVKRGLVESAPELLAETDDARRKYYRITDVGRNVLLAEVKRTELLAKVARARLKAKPDANG